MPWTRELDLRLALVRAVFTGPCTMDDVAAYLDGLADDPHFDPMMREVVDLRGASFDAHHTELSRAARIDPFDARTRRALIVPDDLHFGMVRQFDAARFEPGGGPHPVRSPAEAAAHLELSVADLGLADPSAGTEGGRA